MKLTLIFLLCLVCYGVTQGTRYQLPQYRSYRTFYDPRLAFYYPTNQDLYFPDFDEADYSSVSNPIPDYADTEARGPVRGLSNGRPQPKLFGFNLISQLLNSINSPVQIFPQTTFTSTFLQTAASVVTTTSIKSCIAVGQFAKQSSSVANSFITYTQPCRRRRGIFEELDAIKALKLVPTPVEQMEKSVAPEMVSLSRNERSENQPEIVSSQDLPIEEQPRSINKRPKRAVVTVTSTITTISFTATTVTKNFALAFSPAATVASDAVALTTGLFCLPSGFTVC